MRNGAIASLLLVGLTLTSMSYADDIRRVTNLYDAFGPPSTKLVKDWGFASLIEYGGKRILFDTGNDAGIFEHNVKALGVDLTQLDAVVISHRHGDHTTGLTYLLEVNPGVAIYVPQEGAFFKAPMPADFFARHPDLPPDVQYFDAKDPGVRRSGSPWKAANFKMVSDTTEIFPGFYILSVQSQKAGTIEMNELSLAIRTARGLAVVVGCSHPGVEKILAQVARIDARLYTVIGGYHLVRTPEPEVRRVAHVLRDQLKIERVAPAHCTSELGFSVFLELFKERFDRAGLGAVIVLP